MGRAAKLEDMNQKRVSSSGARREHERIRKRREKLLSDYVPLVPKSKLEDTLGSDPDIRNDDPDFFRAHPFSDSPTGPQPRGTCR